MPAITVKNIPENLYEHLKAAANAHHRSINSELIVCLEKVLIPHSTSATDHIVAARALRIKVKASNISLEDIQAAKNSGRP